MAAVAGLFVCAARAGRTAHRCNGIAGRIAGFLSISRRTTNHMSRLSYDESVRLQLEDIQAGLSEDMGLMIGLSPTSASAAIHHLLSLACEAQNDRNITLGREYLARIPRGWLVERIERDAQFLLDADDEWEYRRLLEVYAILDDGLVRRLVEWGRSSPNVDIREAAHDWHD